MRRIFVKISLICIILMLIISSNFKSKNILSRKTEEPKISFGVMSDVHIGARNSVPKFKNALRDLKNICNNYSTLIFVGDSTDSGEESQYKDFLKCLKDEGVKLSKTMIAMGNHEYYTKDFKDFSSCENRFLKYVNREKLYFDEWIKGYHFIVLAPESRDSANISKDQLSFLKEKLNEKLKTNKPIFVFLHQPFKNTVFGSDGWGGIENEKELYDLLKDYPQVIFFSGHSHYYLDNENTVFKDGFHMINTGAINYIMTEGDGYANSKLSQDLIIDVYKDKVNIRCREISKNKWIGNEYSIDFK